MTDLQWDGLYEQRRTGYITGKWTDAYAYYGGKPVNPPTGGVPPYRFSFVGGRNFEDEPVPHTLYLDRNTGEIISWRTLYHDHAQQSGNIQIPANFKDSYYYSFYCIRCEDSVGNIVKSPQYSQNEEIYYGLGDAVAADEALDCVFRG